MLTDLLRTLRRKPTEMIPTEYETTTNSYSVPASDMSTRLVVLADQELLYTRFAGGTVSIMDWQRSQSPRYEFLPGGPSCDWNESDEEDED